MANREYSIGDVYWFDLFGSGTGSVQKGWHPGVIVQNNVGNKYSPTMAIIPITSKTASKKKLPTHVYLKKGSCGLARDSLAQCEGQQLICKDQIGEYIGKCDKKTMSKIAKGCLINTPYVAFLSYEEIEDVKNRAAV